MMVVIIQWNITLDTLFILFRAKVEKSAPNSKTVPVFYVDYGNKAQVAIVDSVAALPAR